MDLETEELIYQKEDLLSFSIFCNGKSIDPDVLITSITIYQQAGLEDRAEITMSIQHLQVAKKSTYDLFKYKDHIQISIGYIPRVKRVFDGNIQNLRLHLDTSYGEMLTLQCSAPQKRTVKDIKPLNKPKYNINLGVPLYALDLSFDMKNEYSSSWLRLKGTMAIQGTDQLDTDTLLRLVDASDVRFSTDVHIQKITHQLAEGRWITTLEVGES